MLVSPCKKFCIVDIIPLYDDLEDQQHLLNCPIKSQTLESAVFPTGTWHHVDTRVCHRSALENVGDHCKAQRGDSGVYT